MNEMTIQVLQCMCGVVGRRMVWYVCMARGGAMGARVRVVPGTQGSVSRQVSQCPQQMCHMPMPCHNSVQVLEDLMLMLSFAAGVR